MKKYLLYAAAVVIGIVAIATSVTDSSSRATKASPSASASATTSPSAGPSQKLKPSPEHTDGTPLPTPELYIEDLGEDTCKKFEVCTFVNITANATCKNAEISIDLFDDNDENYDTESVPVGTIKSGAKLRSLEVGTDDTDAAYVEQSDFTCG